MNSTVRGDLAAVEGDLRRFTQTAAQLRGKIAEGEKQGRDVSGLRRGLAAVEDNQRRAEERSATMQDQVQARAALQQRLAAYKEQRAAAATAEAAHAKLAAKQDVSAQKAINAAGTMAALRQGVDLLALAVDALNGKFESMDDFMAALPMGLDAAYHAGKGLAEVIQTVSTKINAVAGAKGSLVGAGIIGMLSPLGGIAAAIMGDKSRPTAGEKGMDDVNAFEAINEQQRRAEAELARVTAKSPLDLQEADAKTKAEEELAALEKNAAAAGAEKARVDEARKAILALRDARLADIEARREAEKQGPAGIRRRLIAQRAEEAKQDQQALRVLKAQGIEDEAERERKLIQLDYQERRRQALKAGRDPGTLNDQEEEALRQAAARRAKAAAELDYSDNRKALEEKFASNREEAVRVSRSVMGGFDLNATMLRSMAGGKTAADRTAKATELTAERVAELNRRVADGSGLPIG